MPHDTTSTQAVCSTTVTDINGKPLNFPLAQHSLLQQYDTDKVLDAVSDFVCFDADWFKKYLTRWGVMVRMSGYNKSEMESMECFLEAIEELVSKIEAAHEDNCNKTI